MVVEDSLFNGWRLSDEELEAHVELLDDVEQYGSNCANVVPSPWTDYGDDGEPFQEPNGIDAAMMCSGCPIIESCFEFAKINRPVHGVWGGIKWRNGRSNVR